MEWLCLPLLHWPALGHADVLKLASVPVGQYIEPAVAGAELLNIRLAVVTGAYDILVRLLVVLGKAAGAAAIPVSSLVYQQSF